MSDNNHYRWLEENFQTFLNGLNITNINNNIIASHGDRCYNYKDIWEKHNIPFNHGVALYLLTYIYPYGNEVRYTKTGFIKPYKWVINNYSRFKRYLPDTN